MTEDEYDKIVNEIIKAQEEQKKQKKKFNYKEVFAISLYFLYVIIILSIATSFFDFLYSNIKFVASIIFAFLFFNATREYNQKVYKKLNEVLK
jgi:Na+/H+ antiporter NhaD/arsenite permease-like protein